MLGWHSAPLLRQLLSIDNLPFTQFYLATLVALRNPYPSQPSQ